MKKRFIWIKENYLLIVAFILFLLLMFSLTREGADILEKVIESVKNIFV